MREHAAPQNPESAGRSEFPLWLPLAIAAAARLLFIVLLPVADHGNDSYLNPALELSQTGRYASEGTLHRLPGAPLFFALVFVLAGERPLAAVLAQHLLGIATLALAMGAARRACGDRAAFLAGLLLAIHFQFPYQECFLLSEPVAQFWLSLALYLGVRGLEEKAPPRLSAAAGLASGLAALSRGELLVVGPILAVLSSATAPRARRSRGAAFLGVWALVVGGWAARNAFLFGYAGLTPDGMTVVADTAWPLIRYDLPSQPLAKRVFKEGLDSERTSGLNARAYALTRLQSEHGLSYLESQRALLAVLREAIGTQPLRYLGLAMDSFTVRPQPWLTEDSNRPFLVQARARGPWAARAWFWLERSQAWGWLLLVLAALSPLAWMRGSPHERRALALLAASMLGIWIVLSLFRFPVARYQSQLFLPLGLLAGVSLDRLLKSVLGPAGRTVRSPS